jgi:alpha-amylase
MPTLSLCFQVHQPYRLRPFSFFDVGRSTEYFDTSRNKLCMEQASVQAYAPAHAALTRIFQRWGEAFQCSFLLSGTAIEQLRDYAPQALAAFRGLSKRTEVELLGGTYYHSLACLARNQTEFSAQVELHRQVLRKEFGVSPKVFCDPTQLVSDQIAESIRNFDFSGIIASDIIDVDTGRPACRVCSLSPVGIRVLPCNQEMLSNVRLQEGYIPALLTPEHVARKLQEIASGDDVVNLVLDYEVCSSSLRGSSNEPSFVEALAAIMLQIPGWRFLTPSRVLQEAVSPGLVSNSHERARATTQSRGSQLLGNSMQRKAFYELYEGSGASTADLHAWRKLQSIDHFRFMSTSVTDGAYSAKRQGPFESPYDAFIVYMNVLRALGNEARANENCGSSG